MLWLVVVAFAVMTLGTGLYFMAFRPAMLPEDLRFSGLREGLAEPLLGAWLRIVFRTLGGFVVGVGLSVLGRGVAGVMNQPGLSRIGMAAGCVFAFGSFLVSNIQLRSDHVAFVALLFIGAVASAVVVLSVGKGDANRE